MKITSIALLAAVCAVTYAQEVSVKSLLPQMTDLTFLTHRPLPNFKMAQASSYDRHSDPGPNTDPFANGDAGNYVRIEDGPNGKEYVMADLKGPGAVVRIWSANPSGTLNMYFDGEKQPRVKVNMTEFLTGRMRLLPRPFSYDASSGANLYFPFPYAKSLKITTDTTNGGQPTGLYYHVGYRTYEAGTKVQTFQWDQVDSLDKLTGKIAEELVTPKVDPSVKTLYDTVLKKGTTTTSTYQPPISSAIRVFQVKVGLPSIEEAKAMKWEDPRQAHNILRNLILTVMFDSEKCIETPLGDFFGSAPGLNPYENLPMTVSADGTMTCRFVMPFEKVALISIRNLGPDVPVTLKTSFKPFPWSPSTYHFHAQWLGEKGRTRPFRDMTFLDVKGEGFFVGTNLHVANPAPEWWGEGDEKAWVDGESFPSTFGTGSEDYYGYAWGSNQLFTRPYHAQTRCDGPGSMGHTSLNRWQIFDPISYATSLRFSLEMWHWADCISTFVHTAYWYSKPGGTPAGTIDESLLLPPVIEPTKPVEGAVEGENLKIISCTGGTTEVQDGFWQISGGKQLWWRDCAIGDKIVLEIPVPEDGNYEVIGNFCHARDYGIHKMTLNGQAIKPIDFFLSGIEWTKSNLGIIKLTKGTVTLEVECGGQNEKALSNHMFGLDYLLLKKK